MQTPASPPAPAPAPLPAQAPAAPASPAAPAPPPPGVTTIQIPVAAPPGVAGASANPFVVTVQTVPVPRTEAEVAALRERGTQLSRQLTSAQGRRDEVARELRGAEGADRAGLEQRLMLLDQRIFAIETDIAANGRLLAAAPASLRTASEARVADGGLPFVPSPGQFTAIAIVFNLFVLAPIAFAYARRLLRRPLPVSPGVAESNQRLERMEQAVDSIAIEMERVSENQRFLTRILTEAGPMQALPVGGREGAPVRVGDA